MVIEFYKYQGTGNDFIIIDDRRNMFDINNTFIAALCKRKIGIGADGLILLREHKVMDFEMIYFNSDGKQSSMCGNGGRCIISFARYLGIIENETTFLAIDGEHRGKILDNDIALQMNNVTKIKKKQDSLILDTGSPHCVIIVDNLDNLDVESEGKRIRNSSMFKEDGVNVNFVETKNLLKIRTYERGVEAETLSCGTGVVAAAISIHYLQYTNENELNFITRGGELSVNFEVLNGIYSNIWLHGAAEMVYQGKIVC